MRVGGVVQKISVSKENLIGVAHLVVCSREPLRHSIGVQIRLTHPVAEFGETAGLSDDARLNLTERGFDVKVFKRREVSGEVDEVL